MSAFLEAPGGATTDRRPTAESIFPCGTDCACAGPRMAAPCDAFVWCSNPGIGCRPAGVGRECRYFQTEPTAFDPIPAR